MAPTFRAVPAMMLPVMGSLMLTVGYTVMGSPAKLTPLMVIVSMTPPTVMPVISMVALLAGAAPFSVVPDTATVLPSSYNAPASFSVTEYVPLLLVMLNSAPLPKCGTLGAAVPE